MKLIYNDTSHTYYLDGKRAKSVTAVAKIPVDTYSIEQWSQRQVAIGLAMDKNLVENIAVDIDNRDALNNIVEQAKQTASAHRAADRGSQMHRVLQLVLLDQEHKLLTDQQRTDAELLKRTLDLHKLTPYDALTEQFVAWPHHTVTGRFDAILERPDGKLILTDLKSGPNAATYPHATAIQLALYARAPHISDAIATKGDRSEVIDWRTMPERLEYRYAYVLLAQPGTSTGTFHEINIEHGWAAARMALAIVNWRKEHNYGKDIVQEIPPPLSLLEQACIAPTLKTLRELWTEANDTGELSDDFRAVALERSQQLKTSGAA